MIQPADTAGDTVRRTIEFVLLLPVGVILTPIVFVLGLIGTVLSIPVLIERIPWKMLVTRPGRFLLALAILAFKFVAEWISTVGYAGIFFGRSLSRDPHSRGWQLPWTLRVRHRLVLTLARYFGMLRMQGRLAALAEQTLAWCRANPPSPAELELEMPILDARTIDPSEFYRRWVANPRPVVLRGLASDSPAVREWTPEYFRRYAADIAPVSSTGADTGSVMRSTLGEYLDYIAANQDLPLEQRTEPRYLANFANLCNSHPELLDQLALDRVAPFLVGAKRADSVGAHLFIGLSGTGTPFHCAVAPNWFVQVQGRKRWTFVHPDHTPMMYSVIGGDAYFAGSLLEYPEPSPEEMAVDFPLWQFCPRYEVVLEPGDVLYNPPWYWHRIRNETSPTIGAASRWVILPFARSNKLFDFFLTYHASFFANVLGLLCTRADEPRLSDETALTLEQRRSRLDLYQQLRARLPSRQLTPPVRGANLPACDDASSWPRAATRR
jgi:hypothetical protein